MRKNKTSKSSFGTRQLLTWHDMATRLLSMERWRWRAYLLYISINWTFIEIVAFIFEAFVVVTPCCALQRRAIGSVVWWTDIGSTKKAWSSLSCLPKIFLVVCYVVAASWCRCWCCYYDFGRYFCYCWCSGCCRCCYRRRWWRWRWFVYNSQNTNGTVASSIWIPHVGKISWERVTGWAFVALATDEGTDSCSQGPNGHHRDRDRYMLIFYQLRKGFVKTH